MKSQWRSGFAAGFNYATAKHEALRSSCQTLVDMVKRHESLLTLADALDHELTQIESGKLVDDTIVEIAP
jgi:DnaJ-domain-containing protein 1